MPRLIELVDGEARWTEDGFLQIVDEDAIPETGDVILSLARFETEGDALLSSNSRRVGVRVESHEEVEGLAYDLPRIAVVALVFPKYRDGRAYTSARLLRERFGYQGQIRAVGDVLREQAGFMVRCGFDAFEPADGATPEAWTKAASRFRHVYQRGADARPTAFEERAS
ncbi:MULTISPECIES: DUF934 domain-containing protein [Caulobacter]|jgi:uncharacterized protein (DUF934 family)|uniref:Oxidoreductase n=1 Tax=Caulobacter vibrioides OR37 TaxID=1292034 RepID=R0E6V6_CAUVI|nr:MULTISPECIES: DUF934 domain-containing protein [Caulobacter]ENZ81228.1 hypothetical protein OR37_02937 [Caulobacter vibrioides OR37]MBQ1562514.1 DUF934 domain-containing protein [Caulobacter sp.]